MGIFPTFKGDESVDPNEKNGVLAGKKILLIGTGSVSAMYLPAWISWFNENHPDATLRTVLTPSAKGFVGLSALGAFSRSGIEFDSWQGHETDAYHVELQLWADAIIVFPATANYLAKFAQGACDTPAMLALQTTSAPILIAPALPPGFLGSEAWKIHTEAISRRDNVILLPPVKGKSSYDLSVEAYPPQSFMKVVAELIKKLQQTDNSSMDGVK